MSSPLLERLRFEAPVVQAPLGGGISSPELAAAVSNAGGLGSVGMRSPSSLRRDFARARALAPGRSLALGLLLPFVRGAHVEATVAAAPDAVVLMAGFAPTLVARLRAAGIYVMHQVGSRAGAERALRDGAEALIAQGVEAGGHVLGDEPAAALLPQVIAIAGDKPVLLSGGIATAGDVRVALQRGAAAVMAGTRYLLTREARAHDAYKQRVLGAERTLLTTLFGVGWSLKHRVVPNAATARFCDEHGGIPRWVSLLQRGVEPFAQRFGMLRDPTSTNARSIHGLPLFLPDVLRPEQAEHGVEYMALYAGESAARVHAIEDAFAVTRSLAAGARAT